MKQVDNNSRVPRKITQGNVFNYSSKTPPMGARGQMGSEGFQVVGFIKNHELKGPEGEYPQRDGQYMSTHNFSRHRKCYSNNQT